MCVEPTNRCTSILHLYLSSSENYSLHFGLYFSIWNELLKFLMFFFYLIFFPCLLTLSLLSYLVSHLLLCGVNTHILHPCLEHYVISVSVFFLLWCIHTNDERVGKGVVPNICRQLTLTEWIKIVWDNCLVFMSCFAYTTCVYVCIFFFCLYHNWSQLSSLNMNFLSYLISKYICLLWMIQYLIHIWQFKWGELWVECNLSSWFTLSVSFLHLSLRFLIL